MKTLVNCRNYKREMEVATSHKFDYNYYYPLCLNNKLLTKDSLVELIGDNDINDHAVFCCDLCKNTTKLKDSVNSKSMCFYQVLNEETVNHYINQGYYLVTPGWLENWKDYVEKDWSFTQDVARNFFENTFSKVLMLDTMVYENSKENLEDFARFINKDYEILPVGMDHFKNYIKSILDGEMSEMTRIKEENKSIKNQLINYTMSVELIKNMSAFTDQDDILEKIFDILRMMFMPGKICFIPYAQIEKDTTCKQEHKEELNELLESNSKVVWLNNGKGFASKIYYGEQLLGLLVLDEIYLPEYQEVYYNTFLSITNVIALALYNTELYEEVVSVNKDYQQQKSYFEQLFKNSPDMIIITNNDLTIQNLNDSFLAYFKNSEHFVGQQVNKFLSAYESNQALHKDEDVERKIIINLINQNRPIHLEISMYPIDVFGDVVGYYIILVDVTDRVAMQKQLQDMAFNDSLTGLFNRAFCDVEMIRLAENRQLPLGVIIGDVNGLKITNDAFGHIAGDDILKNIAHILRKSCRKGDIISRWGGDEFVIILPNTEIEIVKSIADRIEFNCQNYKDFEFVVPSISLGYSVLKHPNRTVTEVFIEAEKMMYNNKLLQKDSIRSKIVSSLESSLFEKSYETEEHAIRVSEMCVEVAKKLNMSQHQINEIELFARLHDIGKLLIDNVLLEKSEPLTRLERKKIQEHSESGYRIANSIPELAHLSHYILYHHERVDGNGYPNGAKGTSIPIQSRILTIADSIDAMRSDRPYSSAKSDYYIKNELLTNKDTQFDGELVDIFIELFFKENKA